MRSKILLAARWFFCLPLSFLLLLVLRFSAPKCYAATAASFDITPPPGWDAMTDTAQTGMPYSNVTISIPSGGDGSLTSNCFARYVSGSNTVSCRSVSAQRVICRAELVEPITLSPGIQYLIYVNFHLTNWNNSTDVTQGNVSLTVMLPGVSKSHTYKDNETYPFEFNLAPTQTQTISYLEFRINASEPTDLDHRFTFGYMKIMEVDPNQSIVDSLDLARDELVDINMHLPEIKAAIEQNWDEITGAIGDAAISINTALGTQTTTITNSITGSTATLTGAIGDSASLVSGAIGSLQTAEDGFFTRLLNGITSLIVPDEDGMNDILDEFNDFMEDHFGVLYYPIGVTIDIIRLFYNIPVDTDEAKLTFPAIEVMDHELSDEVEVDLNDIVALGSGNAVTSVLHNLYVIYRLIISGVIVITLVLLCWKKMKELKI